MVDVAGLPVDRRQIGLAQARRRFHQRLKHSLEIECRPADDLQHVGGRGLLLERFAQLVEQTCVLYRDHGLRSKVLDQVDLLIGKGTYLLAGENDCSDQFIVLEHWDRKDGPIAANFDARSHEWMALDVGRYRRDVGNVGYLLRFRSAAKRRVRRRAEQRLARARFDVTWRCIVGGNQAEAVAITITEE